MNEKVKKQRAETVNLDAYRFIIRGLTEDEGGGFLIEYPDVPGCISDGETPEQAIANGRDASALLVMRELKGPIPDADQFASGQWRQRVPRSLHARLIERAHQDGVSLNTPVTAMIAERLGKRLKSKGR